MIKRKRNINNSGLTIIELVIAAAMATISMLAISAVFSDSQKSWNATYQKAYSGVVTESHVARKAFEATIRRAVCDRYRLDDYGQWVEVYYFATDTSPKADRYARLYASDGIFLLEYGIYNSNLNPPGKETLGTLPICQNVTACSFSGAGRCIRMSLTLAKNGRSATLLASATPQNQ